MSFLISFVLIVLAPFHALAVTFLKTLPIPSGLFSLLSAWREVLLAILGVLAIPSFIQILRDPSQRKSFWKEIRWFLPFLLLPFVFLVFQKNLEQWMWGVRFDLMLFVAVIVFWLIPLSGRQKNILEKGILWTAFLVFLFGIIHALFLPADFLTNIGYSVNRDIWDVSTSISSCQPLEHTSEFCRAISTFGGPTRYGTYILLIMSLVGYRLFNLPSNYSSGKSHFFGFFSSKIFQKYFLSAIFFLGLLNLFLTYSRSIWVGAFAMLIAALIIAARKKTLLLPDAEPPSLIPPLKSFKKIILVIFGIFLIFIFFTYESWQTIFLREGSSSEHFFLIKQGFSVFTSELLGRGLGTAGPASLHFHKLITENWYLQIGIEMGLLGLIFFLIALFRLFWITFSKNFDPSKSKMPSGLPLFLALLGISVAGLFTHSFEETVTVLLLGALIGMNFSPLSNRT